MHRKNRNNGSGGKTEFCILWRGKRWFGEGVKYSLMCAFVMKCVRIGVMKKCGSHPKEREGEGVSIQTPTLLVCRERFEACGKKKEGGRSPNDAGEPRGGTERLKCLLQLILGPVCRHFFFPNPRTLRSWRTTGDVHSYRCCRYVNNFTH